MRERPPLRHAGPWAARAAQRGDAGRRAGAALEPGPASLPGSGLQVPVTGVHAHPRFEADTGHNDVALRLARPVRCPDAGRPVCTADADFAERVLLPQPGVLGGWTLRGRDGAPGCASRTWSPRSAAGPSMPR